MRLVEVALPLPLRHLFTYLAPEQARVGSVVRVSFGRRTLWGVVWQESQPNASGPLKNLKSIESIHPCIFMGESMRQFLLAMATYTLSPLGQVLKLVLPSLAYESFIPHSLSDPGDQEIDEGELLSPLPSFKDSSCKQGQPNHKGDQEPPPSDQFDNNHSLVPKQDLLNQVKHLDSVSSLGNQEEQDTGATPCFPACGRPLPSSKKGSPTQRASHTLLPLDTQPCNSYGNPLSSDVHVLNQGGKQSILVHQPPARHTSLYPALKPHDLCTAHPLSFWKKKIKGGTKAFKKYFQQGYFVPAPFSTEAFSVQLQSPLTLSPTQQGAFAQCQEFVQAQKPVLLEGITGSGKTEVLLALCHEVWKKGKQVLILLPEIVLSHQWEKRVLKYFDVECRVWHSNLSESVRQKTFEDILYNRCPLIIGARSALFLPYTNLGMIVVDEEHESGYKQSETTLYHGRDMALLRGSSQKIPIVLASATPSLESRFNVSQNRYGHVRLNERYGQARLPSFECIDMRPHPPKDKKWISPALRQIISDTFARGEQSLLFLNRRGYACLFLCFRCNYRASCPQCSAWLSVHQKPSTLLCHYCGYSLPLPQGCPGCGQNDALLMMGPGIERIHEEISHLLPQARIALISSDHVSSPQSIQKLLTQITAREVDILVGTQLVAKGHHFPHLTTIGIIDTDFALNDMDFRASERLFQLLYQVTGRAGRAELPGRAYLQTLQPDHPLFSHILGYDWDGFVGAELERRKQEDLPPFTRMASLTLSDRCEWRVQDVALELAKGWNSIEGVDFLGPAPAPMNPLRGRYRWRFLFKAPRSFPLHTVISRWMEKVNLPKALQVQIDRDPYHFL